MRKLHNAQFVFPKEQALVHTEHCCNGMESLRNASSVRKRFSSSRPWLRPSPEKGAAPASAGAAFRCYYRILAAEKVGFSFGIEVS
jgi:hypothetical protein